MVHVSSYFSTTVPLGTVQEKLTELAVAEVRVSSGAPGTVCIPCKKDNVTVMSAYIYMHGKLFSPCTFI